MAQHVVIFLLLFTVIIELQCEEIEDIYIDREIDRRIQSTTNKIVTGRIRPNVSNASNRQKRDAKPSDFNSLRAALAKEKAKELQPDGGRVRLSENGTGGIRAVERFGGLNTQHSGGGTGYDNIHKVYQLRNLGREFYADESGIECSFEEACKWTWKTDVRHGFVISGVANGSDPGPRIDANGNENGHFLMIRLKPTSKETDWNWTLTSPMFEPSTDKCKLQLWVYQENMHLSIVQIILQNINKTQIMLQQIYGEDSRKWLKLEKVIGKTTQKFQIIIEVVPARPLPKNVVIAFDNINLLKCYPEVNRSKSCTPSQYRCNITNICINNSEICDLTENCLYGDDEALNCDKIPFGGRCNFEVDWCGWENAEGRDIKWIRDNGNTTTNRTGPPEDHTYGNSTGKYLHVTINGRKDVRFAATAGLKSVIFNPPPRVHGNSSSRYYNSCMVRFYLHKFGNHKNALMLQVTELRPNENFSRDLLWSFDNFIDPWIRQVIILPNITHKYFLHFDFLKSIRYVNDIAIDDFSLSPECFGQNIPPEELNGYNYWNPVEFPPKADPHDSFLQEPYYVLRTCNVTGRYGPSQKECVKSYNGTKVRVDVMKEPGLNGVQKWTVPSDGYYTFILFGASGGKGGNGMGSTRGAMARAVIELHRGQEIFVLVGQEGSDACIKSLGPEGNSSCQSDQMNQTGVRGVLNIEIIDGGGGGGGGTYVFVQNKTKQPNPLFIAGGGGGLGLGRFIDTGMQHGQAINTSRLPVSGRMFDNTRSRFSGVRFAGSGGGWEAKAIDRDQEGVSLSSGADGGKACYNSTDGSGDGGFGGGGGGCTTGGGGGGYAGGNADYANTTNGEGGYSYIDPVRALPNFSEALSGLHVGPGMVVIIPAIPGCGCDYRCVALDLRRSQVRCICPKNWVLDENGKSCNHAGDDKTVSMIHIVMGIVGVIAAVFLGGCAFVLYNKYQQNIDELHRQKMLNGPDLQLNRLRVASDGMITEYNPNYEFGGQIYTIKDLKDIPRNQLRLLKALGQGAFGEVYQGFYRQRASDTVEMPVAVKTLPEMSTNQAEMDFLMEALIMSKFNHANIVHFIGVCFDKHPRFIVLELLAGGDLKNFLRESRPKPERGSQLSMKDLVHISIDVANGCKYLEDNRFIHRDIAARNCLLTTKGPGRVVKIADFGMSRDIYRSDYYRKGGTAMLPIKWMPPEAFLDGIFTSKTDVWSYGVLLWEIMSMGYMPYTGCANREVMQLVTSGGRLEPPANCPGPIYGIMTQCWHPKPEQRPTFCLILERLGYCAQDPQVMTAPLPVFNRPPSHERDATVMRPNTSVDNCLQVPQVQDYLEPNHPINRLGVDDYSSSIDKLLPNGQQENWETSFALPQSKLPQPLLGVEMENNANEAAGSVEKLLTIDAQPKLIASSISPNNMQQSNHNNNAKHESNLKSGIALDAGALVKQSMPAANSYTKNTTDLTGNGVLQNGAYAAAQNNYTSEISC